MTDDYCLVVTAKGDFRESPLCILGIEPVVDEIAGLALRFATVHQDSVSEVMRQLAQAKLILVDLERGELDLSYVVGICHARSLRTILICTSQHDLPNLLRRYPRILYGLYASSHEREEFRRRLLELVSSALDDPYESNTPIQDYFPPGKKETVPKEEKERLERQLAMLEEEYRVSREQLEKALKPKSFLVESGKEDPIPFRPVREEKDREITSESEE